MRGGPPHPPHHQQMPAPPQGPMPPPPFHPPPGDQQWSGAQQGPPGGRGPGGFVPGRGGGRGDPPWRHAPLLHSTARRPCDVGAKGMPASADLSLRHRCAPTCISAPSTSASPAVPDAIRPSPVTTVGRLHQLSCTAAQPSARLKSLSICSHDCRPQALQSRMLSDLPQSPQWAGCVAGASAESHRSAAFTAPQVPLDLLPRLPSAPCWAAYHSVTSGRWHWRRGGRGGRFIPRGGRGRAYEGHAGIRALFVPGRGRGWVPGRGRGYEGQSPSAGPVWIPYCNSRCSQWTGQHADCAECEGNTAFPKLKAHYLCNRTGSQMAITRNGAAIVCRFQPHPGVCCP